MATYQIPREHIYNGMVLPAAMPSDRIEELSDLEVTDGDILVASYPKTGTTWMQELVELINFNGDVDKAHVLHLQKKVVFLEVKVPGVYDSLEILKVSPRPWVLKTHMRAETFQRQILEGRLKVIVVIRNPKDTLVSMYHFYRMNIMLGNFTGSWDEFFELYKLKHILNGDYFDWYDSWMPQLSRPNVLLVKYEDMKRKMPEVVKSVSEFMGKSLTDEVMQTITEHTTFDKMKSNKMTNDEDNSNIRHDISSFFRKGMVGDWKSYFTEEQSKVVDEDYTKRLANDITLDFE